MIVYHIESDSKGRAETAPSGGFRPDIQGLRAVAVGVVVLYHLWPAQLSGGYVGVDVFFVISGYLITSQLWREATTTGTIAMRSFYARRALRLLPAAMLVLAVTAVASLLILPEARWENTYRQLVASAAYVENWLLARDSVDYLLQHAAVSPVQHFWSLSAEEQFYAFWPVLILLVLWLVARVRRDAPEPIRQRAVLAALAALILVSLAYSVVATAVIPKQAFFITPTRVWEFGVGAVCALLVLDPVRWGTARWGAARVAAGWLGVAAILAASGFFVTATPFPGYAALLPVLGAAAVILGAPGTSRRTASWWLARRPAVAVGDISYAIYLWHWPLLILVPLALDRPLSVPLKLAVLAATVALSWLSTHRLEQPLRRNPFLRARRWPALAMALGGVALMLVAAQVATSVFQTRVRVAAASLPPTNLTTVAPCQGAAVFDAGATCPSKLGAGPVMAPALAIKDQSNLDYLNCDSWLDQKAVNSCDLGPADSPIRVAIVGDSHALQWLGAVRLLAHQGRWHIRTFFKTSCPFANALRVVPSEPAGWQRNCADWQQEVTRRIVADGGIDYVIVTAFSRAYHLVPLDGRPAGPTFPDDAWRSMWRALTEAGKKVVVLRDTPATRDLSIPECVERHGDDLLQCALARSKALPADPITRIALDAQDPDILTMDLTDGFCDESYCYGVAGDVIVYRDTNHLTWQYSESLAPRFYATFRKAIGR